LCGDRDGKAKSLWDESERFEEGFGRVQILSIESFRILEGEAGILFPGTFSKDKRFLEGEASNAFDSLSDPFFSLYGGFLWDKEKE
jgi:hypothetical protein|tara:strand:- start:147 stop:404 length:258 start_codon:yes stop_codon:yes gene_type:complete